MMLGAATPTLSRSITRIGSGTADAARPASRNVPIPACRSSRSAAGVLGRGHELHVGGILADPISTQMVHAESWGDGSEGQLPGDPMRVGRGPVPVESTVSIGDGSLSPAPALIRAAPVHERPEVFGGVDEDGMLSRDTETIPAGGAYTFVLVEGASEPERQRRTARILRLLPAIDHAEDARTSIAVPRAFPYGAVHAIESNRLWEAS